MMVLRLRLINFPKNDTQDPKDPNYPQQNGYLAVAFGSFLGKIIKLNVKIKGTVKSLHWQDYRWAS